MFSEIHALDDDGNLFDTASYRALSGLSCAIVAASKLGQADYPLPPPPSPLSVTFAKIRIAVALPPSLTACVKREIPPAAVAEEVEEERERPVKAERKIIGGP